MRDGEPAKPNSDRKRCRDPRVSTTSDPSASLAVLPHNISTCAAVDVTQEIYQQDSPAISSSPGPLLYPSVRPRRPANLPLCSTVSTSPLFLISQQQCSPLSQTPNLSPSNAAKLAAGGLDQYSQRKCLRSWVAMHRSQDNRWQGEVLGATFSLQDEG
jgi:hypothetical protein